jgi:hypothetical protein
MQKYKSNITDQTGNAIRNVPVTVLKQDGTLASLFLDQAGTVVAPNPVLTGADGTFYFYAVNGRYSLRTQVNGAAITDSDVVLLFDPQETVDDGPIAEAVRMADDAAQRAVDVVENSGIETVVADAQAALSDALAAVDTANSAITIANASVTAAADSASNASTAADNASASASAAASSAQSAEQSAQDAANTVAAVDYFLNRANHTGREVVTDGTASTSTTTGALVVAGGVGIGGQLHVGGGIVGTASLATKLATARKINGVDFDGTTDITVPVKFPIGKQEIQFPGMAAPSDLYGGTWTLRFSNEGVFWRSEGGNASAFGTTAAQGDAMRNLTGSFPMLANTAFTGQDAGALKAVPFSTTYGVASGVGGTGVFATLDASLQVPTAAEFRPRNRTFRVWEKTAN